MIRTHAMVLALALGAQAVAAEQPKTILSLDAPITRWDEAIPLGNGLLGGLLWGKDNTVNLSLDRGDLWDLRVPPECKEPGWTYANLRKLIDAKNQGEIERLFDGSYGHPFPTKLPAGRLVIALPEGLASRKFNLNLAEALGTIDFGASRLAAFFDANARVALVELPSEQAEFKLLTPESVASLGYPKAQPFSEGECKWFVQEGNQGYRYVVMVAKHGRTLAVTVSSTDDGKDPVAIARKLTDAALRDGFTKRLAGHKKWWSKFWAVSSVSVPDPKIQAQYDLVKYFHGAASRRGAPPMPLQGVWTADEGSLPPWKGDYHNDLNTQMTYVAYQTAGLYDEGLSFLEFNSKLLPAYRAFAKSFYGVNGAIAPGVMTLDGKPIGGWAQYSLSPTNSAWIATLYARHWRYTMDAKFLKDVAYPWCAEVGRAHLGLLVKGPDGVLRLPLSSSPEIHDNSLAAWLKPNTNYDLALMKAMFLDLASMAEALGKKEEAVKWAGAAKGLGALHVDPAEALLMVDENQRMNESHRHFSHMMAIHPLGLLSVDGSRTDIRIVGNTVDDMLKKGTGAWCGYSFSWMSCMLARIGDGERALDQLDKFVRAFCLRNGFHCNGDQSGTGLSGFTYRPFTLEGNFLAMEAVQEMLLQSWGGRVRVFPAVASAWQDVSFTDLRAEGGFIVSASRRSGRTVSVTVRATVDGELRLRHPFAGSGVWSRKDVKLVGGEVVVKLKKGEVLKGTAQ